MNVDELIDGPQYTLSFADKERIFAPLLRDAYERSARLCPEFGRYLDCTGDAWRRSTKLSDFPPIHVSAFKRFRLRCVPDGEVVLELSSSATTSQNPSRIALDRATARRQARALLSILRSYLGDRRRPFLVLDSAGAGDSARGALGARGAAIRGFGNYATETLYALRDEDGRPRVDVDALQEFAARHRTGDVLIFGFTFLIWDVLVRELDALGLRCDFSAGTLFHGGGWKKLGERGVGHKAFEEGVSRALGVVPGSIHDYYGLVEQVGSIFVDCSEGNKHAPNFASVLIVDPLTLQLVNEGEEGLIQVVSLLPTSYPGHVVLTEDRGRLVRLDGCACGRRDIAFRFTSRVERAEARGCGDTLAEPGRAA